MNITGVCAHGGLSFPLVFLFFCLLLFFLRLVVDLFHTVVVLFHLLIFLFGFVWICLDFFLLFRASGEFTFICVYWGGLSLSFLFVS